MLLYVALCVLTSVSPPVRAVCALRACVYKLWACRAGCGRDMCACGHVCGHTCLDLSTGRDMDMCIACAYVCVKVIKSAGVVSALPYNRSSTQYTRSRF